MSGRSVSSDNGVNLHGLLLSRSSCFPVVLRVMQHVRRVPILRQVHLKEETVDNGGSTLLGSLPQVLVKNLSPHHTYILMLLKRTADVHGDVRRRNHLHLRDSPVDDVQRQVEFADHAERYRAAARLAVVHLSLDEDRLDASLSESFGGGSSRRTSADDGDAEFTVSEVRRGSGCSYSERGSSLGERE